MMELSGIMMLGIFMLLCGMVSFCENIKDKIKKEGNNKKLFLQSKILLIFLIVVTIMSLVAIIDFGERQRQVVQAELILQDSIKTLEQRINKIIESGRTDTITLEGQQIIFTFYDSEK